MGFAAMYSPDAPVYGFLLFAKAPDPFASVMLGVGRAFF